MLTFAHGSSPVNVPHDVVVGHDNDLAGTRAWMREHAYQAAAVLVEPMQGAAGCIPGDPDFLAMLRAETAEVGALLISDDTELAAVNARGDTLRQELNQVFVSSGSVARVTGLGSLLTVGFGAGPDAADLQQLYLLELIASGFWIAARCMIALSLPVTDADCARFVEATSDFVGRYRSEVTVR